MMICSGEYGYNTQITKVEQLIFILVHHQEFQLIQNTRFEVFTHSSGGLLVIQFLQQEM